jgi:glycosyltransferase involved in cell wall biosynthesis
MWQSGTTRLRLLFVHERFGALAGAESNILATSSELKERGHTLGILHGAPTGQGETRWLQVFEDRFTLAKTGNASRVAGVLKTFRPDVVYIHKMADLEVLEALLTAGVPLVRMVHDHDLYCMRSYKYNYFSRRICERRTSPFCVTLCGAFLARNHDGGFPLKWVSYASKQEELRLNRRIPRLVVANQFMREELRRNGFDPARIEIHPPVPPRGDPSVRSNFSDRNFVVYAGQIVRDKGVDVLLESLARVRVPFECFIFGDGNHRGVCEKLSHKLGLSDRVHFKGYVPPEEINLHYRECSVVVVSSVWPEPFGAVGLEGMRYGLPVVAFDAGGIKEWLIDGVNGHLVPWMDRAAFAARVEELLCDKPHAREMGERGRQMVNEHYEFSKYIDGLEDLFGRAAAPTGQAVKL